MNKNRSVLVAAQLVLIAPAALFVLALIARGAGPQRAGLALVAQHVVMWYAGRLWTLWLLLSLLPLVVLLVGFVSYWQGRAEAMKMGTARLISAVTTVAAAAILALVGLHVLMN